MKSARELFEELGYTKFEKHDDVGDFIEYISKDDDCNSITFYYDSKTFTIGTYFLCDIKTLQAINKQIEELNWK